MNFKELSKAHNEVISKVIARRGLTPIYTAVIGCNNEFFQTKSLTIVVPSYEKLLTGKSSVEESMRDGDEFLYLYDFNTLISKLEHYDSIAHEFLASEYYYTPFPNGNPIAFLKANKQYLSKSSQNYKDVIQNYRELCGKIILEC